MWRVWLHTGASAARVQTAPGRASGRLGRPYLPAAGTVQDADCRIPLCPPRLSPNHSHHPPLLSARSSLSPPPPRLLIPHTTGVCNARQWRMRCSARGRGGGGRSSFRMRQRTPTMPKGRLRARCRLRAALRMRQRTPTMPKGCAVRPIRRPDRRMKIEGRIYQYLPLSGIRPIPSRSKCLSSSSIHLSRLSL